jgi:hypothetical protein
MGTRAETRLGPRIFGCALVCVLALSIFSGALAQASTGVIKRAEASGDWTQASVSGSVTWTGCRYASGFEVFSCTWTPYLTIGPGTRAADCNLTARGISPGEGITLAWKGQSHGGVGSQVFDLDGVPLSGAPGQLACLRVLEYGPQPVICIQIYPSPCPAYRMGNAQWTLASALMSVPQKPPAEEAPIQTPPVEKPSVEEPPIQSPPPEERPPGAPVLGSEGWPLAPPALGIQAPPRHRKCGKAQRRGQQRIARCKRSTVKQKAAS